MAKESRRERQELEVAEVAEAQAEPATAAADLPDRPDPAKLSKAVGRHMYSGHEEGKSVNASLRKVRA